MKNLLIIFSIASLKYIQVLKLFGNYRKFEVRKLLKNGFMQGNDVSTPIMFEAHLVTSERV